MDFTFSPIIYLTFVKIQFVIMKRYAISMSSCIHTLGNEKQKIDVIGQKPLRSLLMRAFSC